jgi:hypothetical protein
LEDWYECSGSRCKSDEEEVVEDIVEDILIPFSESIFCSTYSVALACLEVERRGGRTNSWPLMRTEISMIVERGVTSRGGVGLMTELVPLFALGNCTAMC